MEQTEQTYTSADAFLDALDELGIKYIFANFGSDHPSILESLASRRHQGESAPRVILCPHEVTALSAAHGFAAFTGQPQAVIVHTDVGTANLGGSLHNASRSRVPVIIFAGLTPFTTEAELAGSRTIHSNVLQDVRNQHDIVRPYVKWSYDLRTGLNAKQVTFRSHQLATSSPQGPVYLTGAREVLAERTRKNSVTPALWGPVWPQPAPENAVDQIFDAIASARFPVIVTTYLGKDPEAVSELIAVAESLGIGVVEAVPYHMNFPAEHPMHLGFDVSVAVDKADVILALATDVPQLPVNSTPSRAKSLYMVDEDPLKESIPLWYWPANGFVRADPSTFLRQLLTAFDVKDHPKPNLKEDRFTLIASIHENQRERLNRTVLADEKAEIPTPELVCSAIAGFIDESTVVVDETITNRAVVSQYIPRSFPQTFFGNGGTALGWSGGAALGLKLANANKSIVAIVGDGSFYLSVPTSTFWVSHRYQLPILTVILNNGGWNATKQNLLGQYREGFADQTDSFWVNLTQEPNLAGVVELFSGGVALTVETTAELDPALEAAFKAVANGNSAVVDVHIKPISNQQSV